MIENEEDTFRDDELDEITQAVDIFDDKEEKVYDEPEADEVDGDGNPLSPLKVKVDKIFTSNLSSSLLVVEDGEEQLGGGGHLSEQRETPH